MLVLKETGKWIYQNCPHIWQLLNEKAMKNTPDGLAEYCGGGSCIEIQNGRNHAKSIDIALSNLIDICGTKETHDKFSKDLSNINQLKQVSELFCEIRLCDYLGSKFNKLKLRPPTGKGSHSDCRFEVDSHIVFGEIKRFEDTGPTQNGRSIFPTDPQFRSASSSRPRAMDLRSKLHEVYKQFPDESINILFIFHRSIGLTLNYLIQTLWGSGNFFNDEDNYILTADGLFSNSAWKIISACIWVKITEEDVINFNKIWKNPNATNPISEIIANRFDR